MSIEDMGIPTALRNWARSSLDPQLSVEALRAADLIELQGRVISELREKLATTRLEEESR